MKNFNTREEMFLSFPRNIKILEIGVFRGTFSDFIYKNLQPSELHLIDLFEGMVFSGDADGNNGATINLTEHYDLIKTKYAKHSNVFIKKGKSSEILQTYPDDYFDIIYIDGDHSYEGATTDLELSYKKIKNGGLVCGHDYEMNMNKAIHYYQFGVKQAIDTFCSKHKLAITHKALDGCVSVGININK